MIYVLTIARIWLGTLFLSTAGLKLVHYDSADSTVQQYKVVPPRIATAVGYLLPWAELAASILLLTDRLLPLGAIVGTLLGISFAYASVRVLRRKAVIPCGCGGPSRTIVSRETLARALVIVGCNLMLLAAGSPYTVHFPWQVTILLMVIALVPVGLAIQRRIQQSQFMKERGRQRRREARRLADLLATPPPGST